MPEFDIDALKTSWQTQDTAPKYGSGEILAMLNRKSRNYVKYIFWISVAEFVLFLGLTVLYLFHSDDNRSFFEILARLGVKKTTAVEGRVAHLYFLMKVLSLALTGIFMVKFYRNYRKISIEDNLKGFIRQIIRFRKTVNYFIFANLAVLVLFLLGLSGFIFYTLSEQHIELSAPVFQRFLVGIFLSVLLVLLLFWLYYRVVYGILMHGLGKKLAQLQQLEISGEEPL